MNPLIEKLQRLIAAEPNNLRHLRDYIKILEAEAKIKMMQRTKIAMNAKSIPCLICEKTIKMDSHNKTISEIKSSNFDYGAHCYTYGNYGSQVLDMDGCLHFVICDECIIRHSHKMVYEPDKQYPGPIQNARDHYEEWFASISKTMRPDDSYMQNVGPYFRD